MSERLQQMARIAQDEVNDMRRRATTSAAHVLTIAQAEADELRERSEKERHEFETEWRTTQDELRSQLEESRKRLEHLRNESDGQLGRLDAELNSRRAATDQQLAVEMQERRSAMLTKLAHHETAQRDDAGRILESAAQQARAQLADAAPASQRVRADARHEVAAAQRELDELCVLQHQISAQLTAVRALLDWTLPQMPGAGRARPENNDGADKQRDGMMPRAKACPLPVPLDSPPRIARLDTTTQATAASTEQRWERDPKVAPTAVRDRAARI